MKQNITEEQKNLLQQITLQDGRNAWEAVQSLADADRPWVAAGILSCVDHCYDLDRLTINWEARELRYANRTDSDQGGDGVAVPMSDSQWPSQNDFSDIAPYLEGLPTGQPENIRTAIQEESERLIAVAKNIGQFIPSTEWDTIGIRTKKLSGESIVFFDEPNNRVVKFRDPFAYAVLKHENPYTVLYEHHIHNRYFGDVPYRFLGVSQDPVSGGVRLVLEQPFIDTLERPTKAEIHEWFTSRGFTLTDAGYFYSNGEVSFTDVWADNCLKDADGNLRFIDPIIRIEHRSRNIKDYYG